MSLLEARAAPNTGVLKTGDIGIYSDSACTQTLTSITWGTVSPGVSVYKTIYIKNLGNYGQKLSLSTTYLNPTTAKGAIALSWNMERARLAAGQVVAANLTLSVSSNAGGFAAFNVDLLITGVSYGRHI